MAIKRVPACSSDCLVSEGTRQECERDRLREAEAEMPHGFADPLDFLPLNDFLWASVAWLKSAVAIPCWVKASKSADLNLFGMKRRLFSSGCDRPMEARLAWRAHFICVWFDLMAAGRVK